MIKSYPFEIAHLRNSEVVISIKEIFGASALQT